MRFGLNAPEGNSATRQRERRNEISKNLLPFATK
jgi:hypothetical protein